MVTTRPARAYCEPDSGAFAAVSTALPPVAVRGNPGQSVKLVGFCPAHAVVVPGSRGASPGIVAEPGRYAEWEVAQRDARVVCLAEFIAVIGYLGVRIRIGSDDSS